MLRAATPKCHTHLLGQHILQIHGLGLLALPTRISTSPFLVLLFLLLVIEKLDIGVVDGGVLVADAQQRLKDLGLCGVWDLTLILCVR